MAFTYEKIIYNVKNTSIKVEDLKYYTLNKYKCFITTYFNYRWNPNTSNPNINFALSAHTTAWVPLNKYCYEYKNGLSIYTNKLYEINVLNTCIYDSINSKINNTSVEKLISVFGIK